MNRKINLILLTVIMFVFCFYVQKGLSQGGGEGETTTAAGSDTCLTCHSEYNKITKEIPHSILFGDGFVKKGVTPGCEACHGKGSVHVEQGGGEGGIINFKSPTQDDLEKTCMNCHNTGVTKSFLISSHAQENITCGNCHKVHKGK
ncbi:MAG: multiheme c-type cytochrome, partial [bacterium]